jgi:large subunit ribosomal protein L6
MPDRIAIEQQETMLVFKRPTERGSDRALHGLTRTLVANMFEGVTKGFEKTLEIHGIGYRAALSGSTIELALGFSHGLKVDPPEGVTFEVPEQTVVIVKGLDKQKVGQVASDLRALRPPEPYKGKGVRYRGEHVRRKVGKRA